MLQVHERLGTSFKDSRSLNQTIDSLPDCARWKSTSFSITTPEGQQRSQTLHYRDPLEAVKTLYGNPAFAGHMKYAPEHQYSDESEEKEHRLYNEMCTGDWWHQTQAKLPDGATVVPIILSSDKTQLTSFNGSEQAYPVYLTIGNISKAIRRKPSYHAQLLIGYLPSPDVSDLSKNSARILRARLFHAAMEVIMQHLRGPGRSGVELTSGDGAVRRCFTIIACYVADYPEQCLVACTRFGSRCPRCRAAPIEFEDNDLPWMPRKPDATLRTLRHAASLSTAARREAVLKDHGLTHVDRPFWMDHHLCDIHNAITPDILHQLYQGVVDHLIDWLTSLMGAGELDARFMRLPATHGVRSFIKGISGMSQVSGGEHKEMSKQLLGCLVGRAPARAIRATRALLDFLYIAQYQSHSEETIGYLQDALDTFHKNKKIFLELEARTGGHFNIPKLHALQHYVDCIRAFGSTDNCNTEATERLHINYAKEAYRATNKKDYLPQMILWLERQDKMAMFDAHIQWLTGQLPEPPAARHRTPPTLCIAKRPSQLGVSFATLSQSYHAQLFLPALRAYIGSISKTYDVSGRSRRTLYDDVTLPFNTVDTWRRFKLILHNLQLDDAPSITNAVIAQPATSDTLERFDTVLVDEKGTAGETGVTGLRVGRVRVILRIPPSIESAVMRVHGLKEPLGVLVYVEWYSRFNGKNTDNNMYPVSMSQNPEACVVPASAVRRGCQLIPRFDERADRAWTAENVLDRCRNFFVNNYTDHHAYQSIW
ncbi:hypothetical protein FA95DRAFT_1502597 [Auriscalpium vulgare]|uniref:Uncharacterized protein n=1 Tax=Auriscalpium vulgare TaxID=40419 RepID=A0ACB8R8Y3_9AGAM|nr:hypothetical protein FA95DRAFT_1502597 [Auriscalpium vulgare]